MDNQQKILAGVLIITTLVLAGVLYYQYVIKGHGKIGALGVEVYGDSDLTQKVTEIDWGTIFPGEFRTAQLWIVNTGNTPGTLSLAVENWVPVEAGNYIVLSWDYDGSALGPGENKYVGLKLEVLDTILGITDFSMDILISIAS